jgi:hypothetical protein
MDLKYPREIVLFLHGQINVLKVLHPLIDPSGASGRT